MPHQDNPVRLITFVGLVIIILGIVVATYLTTQGPLKYLSKASELTCNQSCVSDADCSPGLKCLFSLDTLTSICQDQPECSQRGDCQCIAPTPSCRFVADCRYYCQHCYSDRLCLNAGELNDGSGYCKD